MNDFRRYDVICDLGGLGNYDPADRACLVCPNNRVCEEEVVENERREQRAMRLRQLRNLATTAGHAVAQGPAVAPRTTVQPGVQPPVRRPSPQKGEGTVVRILRNMAASMMAAGGHEFGEFWTYHDIMPTPEKEQHVKREDEDEDEDRDGEDEGE